MSKKISELTAISGGTFANADLFEVSVDTGSSIYVSRKITGAELIASIGSSNIGNADLTIDTTGTRKLIMGGALSSDLFTIRNSADSTDFFFIRGSGVVHSYSPHSFGDAFTNVADVTVQARSTYGKAIHVKGTTNDVGLELNYNSKLGHLPFYVYDRVSNSDTGSHDSCLIYTDSGSGLTTNHALRVQHAGSSTNNVGIELNVTGGTNNYAIDLVAGDINTTGGIGLSNTYTFGGGSSGDIASMTFTKGILTAVTTVP